MTATESPAYPDLAKRAVSVRKPTDVDAHVGMRLRALREAAGLTQAELAAKMGFSFQQLQKYERGINRVSASRLVEFGTVLGVPLASFFEGVEAVGTANYSASDPAVSQLVAAFGRIADSDKRARALAAVTALAG